VRACVSRCDSAAIMRLMSEQCECNMFIMYSAAQIEDLELLVWNGISDAQRNVSPVMDMVVTCKIWGDFLACLT
jgi:hypothetical protein